MKILWIFVAIFAATFDSSLGYRLPGNVKPTNYILEILTELDESKLNYSGEVWIRVECLSPTNSITLHSKELNVNDKQTTVKEIVGKDKLTSIPVTSVKTDAENDFLVINLGQALKKGAFYIIHVPFVGRLREDLVGYYKSSYVDQKTNTTRWLAVTDFEPTDARKAFVCFDEPAMKAKFTVRLAHKKHLKAVSNMPLTKTIPFKGKEGYVWSHFQESVPMSTYLVAFMVSDFGFNEAPARPNKPTFRIWSRKDFLPQTEFAKEFGPKALDFFEGFFHLKYPLPKMGMVALPDFSSGAMENWGLITYRETSLLYDPKSTSLTYYEFIANTIAHELAHQWFGNLVTMKWWTDLWLNEGFATYMAQLAVDKLFPDWGHLRESAIHYAKYVFEFDSLISSHPISVEIKHPSEIRQIFDTISYYKGSLVLRMMHLFLGNSLQRGLTKYLKKYQYSNAEQNQLWAALTEQAHADGTLDKSVTVKEVMDTWTLQTGYPIVTVTRDYKGTATLSQKIYLLDKPSGQVKDTTWWIPITYTIGSKPDFSKTLPKLWMNNKNKGTAKLTNLDPKSWVLVNIDMAGLYRVKYDDRNWKMLTDVLNSDKYTQIPPMNRADLLMNAFDLPWTGYLTYNQALPLIRYLEREREYLPWTMAFYKLNALKRLLIRTPSYPDFKNFVTKLITPLYKEDNKLTNLPKQFSKLSLHNEMFKWALEFEIEDSVKQVQELFSKWMGSKDPDNNNPIPNDLRNYIYCSAVWSGENKIWEFLFKRYQNSHGGTEKRYILMALGCSKDVAILNRYLDWSITNGSPIRKQDSVSVFIAIIRNPKGFTVANEFLQKRIKDLYEYNSKIGAGLGIYLEQVADYIVYDEELKKFKDFISANNEIFKGAKLAADRSIEKATLHTNWHKKHFKTISPLLKA